MAIKVNLSRLPRFIFALLLSGAIAYFLVLQKIISWALAIPLSLYLVVELQKREVI